MKVIYVDDDAVNRTVLRDMLSAAGLAMAEAADGTSGLQMTADQSYDLVLMDLRMPGMSGLTAIRHLRSRETGGTRVPIIVVTAELSPGAWEMCNAAGADAYIEKPVTMQKLFEVTGGVLARTEGAMLT